MRLTAGRITVFTYKAGLLSRVAHDLRIRADGWWIDVDGDAISGVFPVDGLRVEGEMRGGQFEQRSLSHKDKAKIEKAMAAHVLEQAQHPQVEWRGTFADDGDRVRLIGTLSMHGKQVPVALSGRRIAGGLQIEASLTPTAWGIKPYSALMGAIKLQDRVLVRLTVEGWPPA